MRVNLLTFPQKYPSFGISSDKNETLSSYNTVSDVVKREAQTNISANRQSLIDSIIKKILENHAQKILHSANSVEKYSQPYNKAKILNDLAYSHYQNGDIEKAGITLGASFRVLCPNLDVWETQKAELIRKKENFEILRDFFYCSNNTKAKLFVMKSMNALGSKEFVPIAEQVCNFDADVVLPNNAETIYEARTLLNKHYNLYKLRAFLGKDGFYKSAALNIFSKWGLEKHADTLKPLLNDENLYISAKAGDTIETLSNLKNVQSSDEEMIEEARNAFKKQSTVAQCISNLERGYSGAEELKLTATSFDTETIRHSISKSGSSSLKIELIKLLGNVGTTLSDTQYLKSYNVDEEASSKMAIARAEAMMKILLRSGIEYSYLN